MPMKHSKSKVKSSAKNSYHWRKNKNKWTDTLFEKKLLQNPSLMTNEELSFAIKEGLEWSRAKGKYDWKEDCAKEGKEDEMPFSSEVWGRFLAEASVRLQLIGELSFGRFKKNACGK